MSENYLVGERVLCILCNRNSTDVKKLLENFLKMKQSVESDVVNLGTPQHVKLRELLSSKTPKSFRASVYKKYQ